jgi:lycopene cyclase domain-containing protein
MLSYTLGAAVAVLAALALDLAGTRQRLVARGHFWLAYAVILFFQLVMNGVLTGIPIVTYDPDVHLGLRVANAPVEDIGFGFALVLSVLTVWSRAGTHPRDDAAGDQRRGEP